MYADHLIGSVPIHTASQLDPRNILSVYETEIPNQATSRSLEIHGEQRGATSETLSRRERMLRAWSANVQGEVVFFLGKTLEFPALVSINYGNIT